MSKMARIQWDRRNPLYTYVVSTTNELILTHTDRINFHFPVESKLDSDESTATSVQKKLKNLLFTTGKVRKVSFDVVGMQIHLKGQYSMNNGVREELERGITKALNDFKYKVEFVGQPV